MYITEMHRTVQEMTRQFAKDVIRPVAEKLDREECFPADIYNQMGELGLFGICVPESMSGPGFDTLTYALVMEELSRGYSSIADQCGLVELVSTLLVKHGTKDQQKMLTDLLSGNIKPAYCISEPEAGTDVSGIKTFARQTDTGWILNGEKIWIHNAPLADYGFVLARTNKDAGHKGMSIFIVDLNAHGVERGPKENKMGQRASQIGALTFNEVRLGGDAILGEAGQGFYIMMSVLDTGRVGIAALAVGIAQAGLMASLEYAMQRKQFGEAISSYQGVQWLLADMAKDIEAARLLVHSAACKIDNGERATRACSMAKCFAADMAVTRTADAVQIFGGSGYIRGFEVERLYRDAKITQIYEGTNQIQRVIIAKDLIKHGADT